MSYINNFNKLFKARIFKWVITKILQKSWDHKRPSAKNNITPQHCYTWKYCTFWFPHRLENQVHAGLWEVYACCALKRKVPRGETEAQLRPWAKADILSPLPPWSSLRGPKTPPCAVQAEQLHGEQHPRPRKYWLLETTNSPAPLNPSFFVCFLIAHCLSEWKV